VVDSECATCFALLPFRVCESGLVVYRFLIASFALLRLLKFDMPWRISTDTASSCSSVMVLSLLTFFNHFIFTYSLMTESSKTEWKNAVSGNQKRKEKWNKTKDSVSR